MPMSGPTRRWPLRLALAVVLVGGLALIVYTARRDLTETTTMAGGASAVVIDNPAGAVTVRVAEAGDIVVTRRSRWSVLDPVSVLRSDDGSLEVRSRCRPVAPVCRVDYQVWVPDGVPVVVRRAGGVVDLTGLTGPVRVERGGSEVRARALQGETAISSGGADVHLSEVTGAVQVRTTSGAVVGEGLHVASLLVKSDRGRIDVALADPPERTTVASVRGDVRVVLPAAAYAVDARGGAGTDVGVASDPASVRAVVATSGTGRVSVLPA